MSSREHQTERAGFMLNENDNIQELQDRIASLEEENKKLHTQVDHTAKNVGYGLSFEFKPDDAVLNLDKEIPYLNATPEKNVPTVNPDRPVHTLIKGDNYPALLTLLPKYEGEVDVIYIDPPYNTGVEDFIYDDNYVGKDDGFRHSKWLSFIKPRLELAKKLLKDTGVIFVSIDDHEQAYLKVLMDEVFGEWNFVGSAPRKTRASATTKGDSELQSLSDYLVIYTKNRREMIFQKRIIGTKKYPHEDLRGKFYTVPLNDNGPHGYRTARPNLYYPIYQDQQGNLSLTRKSSDDNEILPPLKSGKEGRWMWSTKKFQQEHQDLIAKDGKIFIKHYYNPKEDQNKLQHEKLWIDKLLNTNGTKDISAIFDKNSELFSYPKPVSLVKWCVSLHTSQSALVLDFFAGSGTTGQAVAELNAEDGGTRQAILITDSGKEGEADIADEITLERMKRVLTGKNWADGKIHPNLDQGLQTFEVLTLPVAERMVVNWDDEGNEIYSESALIKTSSDLKKSLAQLTNGDERFAKALYNAWRRVSNLY